MGILMNKEKFATLLNRLAKGDKCTDIQKEEKVSSRTLYQFKEQYPLFGGLTDPRRRGWYKPKD